MLGYVGRGWGGGGANQGYPALSGKGRKSGGGEKREREEEEGIDEAGGLQMNSWDLHGRYMQPALAICPQASKYAPPPSKIISK